LKAGSLPCAARCSRCGLEGRSWALVGRIVDRMNSTIQILAQESSSGAAAVQFVILLMVPVALYFLMIRPQRKRMRETAALQASLTVGDEVITNSGIYGFITAVEDDLFWIEVDEDVQMRVARAAIQGRAPSRRSAEDADES
jgi:preprotein translocase subunit YajC